MAPAKAAESSLRRPGDHVLVRNSNSNSRLGPVLRLGATPNRRSAGTGMTTMIVWNGPMLNSALCYGDMSHYTLPRKCPIDVVEPHYIYAPSTAVSFMNIINIGTH